MRVVRTVFAFLILTFAWTAGAALAQTPADSTPHMADASDVHAAIASKQETQRQQRADILQVLHQPEAQAVAGRIGLSVTQMESAVAGLDDADLAQLAAPAAQAKAALAGGGTVTISFTALLLILILIVLIAK
jgi:hypothetical protein